MTVKPNSVYNKIYKHQNCRCFYCHTEIDISFMEREHVFPKSKGGRGISNKVLSCPFCNKIKRNLTIEEFKREVINLTHIDHDNADKYKKILRTLNRLLNGRIIREGWHRKSPYKSININQKPIKNNKEVVNIEIKRDSFWQKILKIFK